MSTSETTQPPSNKSKSDVASTILGRPSDWIPGRPTGVGGPGLAWLGPGLVGLSVIAAWFAFASAGGSVAIGFFVGAASIILMAWSFVLAVRIPALEPFFGGLDSVYKVHRWTGTLAILAMFLHVQIEPEIDNGIRGAAKSVADSAEDLAGVAEIMLYVLVGISLIRWVPYRFWRLTHKLLGIPFAMACWHFFTATKTYANNSPWGWYFGAFMIGGLVAYIGRVIFRDMLAQGTRYEISAAERQGVTTELRLKPTGRPMKYRAGQFAVLKIQHPGLREPHVFTIASSPEEPELRFFIRDLGDWTAKIQTSDLVGSKVFVEGPYGTFDPYGHQNRPPVWIAGGVGITPFLSASGGDPQASHGGPPRLVYCVRSRRQASALAELEAAHAAGRIDLVVLASEEGRRLNTDNLAEFAGPAGLNGAHVAICGPKGLIADMSRAAKAAGAAEVETEDFDIRSGIGPDLSRYVDQLVSRR